MEIDQEVLERYHLGTCSAQEQQLVEEWLFSADADELDLVAFDGSKADLKQEMWTEIRGVLPKNIAAVKPKSNAYFMWKGAIAASLFIVAIGAAAYFTFGINSVAENPSLSFSNSSAQHIKRIDAKSYNVSLGPNSSAKINSAAGVIDLSGSLLISPKKDVEWQFEGTTKRVTLKKGQTYIILKNSTGAEGIIVVSESNLLDLPPVMQKQITTQFDI